MAMAAGQSKALDFNTGNCLTCFLMVIEPRMAAAEASGGVSEHRNWVYI